jgi:hypothetical protein
MPTAVAAILNHRRLMRRVSLAINADPVADAGCVDSSVLGDYSLL